MNILLLALLAAFPGERVGGLPTGVVLEPGRWQITIQHRFYSAVFDAGWTRDFLQSVAVSNSHVGVDRGIAAGLSAGAALNVGDRQLALHAAWQPARLISLHPEIAVGLVDPALERVWFSLAAGVPVTFAERFHVFPFLRATGSIDGLTGSFGHTFKYAFGDYRLGLEFEPAFLLSDSGGTRLRAVLDSLPWTVAFERQAGWHNFVFTLGTAYHSLPPAMLTNDVLDITRGRFRLGFAILRKL